MEKITQLSEYRAEGLLREYVRIRHEMEGVERIVALTTWATEVDRLYRPQQVIAVPSARL